MNQILGESDQFSGSKVKITYHQKKREKKYQTGAGRGKIRYWIQLEQACLIVLGSYPNSDCNYYFAAANVKLNFKTMSSNSLHSQPNPIVAPKKTKRFVSYSKKNRGFHPLVCMWVQN